MTEETGPRGPQRPSSGHAGNRRPAGPQTQAAWPRAGHLVPYLSCVSKFGRLCPEMSFHRSSGHLEGIEVFFLFLLSNLKANAKDVACVGHTRGEKFHFLVSSE